MVEIPQSIVGWAVMVKTKRSLSKYILIIDDGKEILSNVNEAISPGYKIYTADTNKAAIKILLKYKPAVVLLNLNIKQKPLENKKEDFGLYLLNNIITQAPYSKVIVIANTFNRHDASKCIQLGASDYYANPINIQELEIIIRRTGFIYELEKESYKFRFNNDKENMFYDIVGKCQAIQEINSVIRRVAVTDTTVLIFGKSGTGKELVAHAIHKHSHRSKNPFVVINCAAISENLLESELFGHEKGSFTGAERQHIGKLEIADMGTVFLDEIGELTLALQVKLLRFIQEKVIERVGGRKSICIDTRIIAASNKYLREEVDHGRFREDLFFRLSVLPITLPPLKDRGDDILFLADFFLQRYLKESNHKIIGFSKELTTLMLQYEWPGNIRELENRIRRGIIMSSKKFLVPEDLGFLREEILIKGASLGEVRTNAEEELVTRYLRKNQGHISKTAQDLQISRPTLHNLFNKLNINPKDFKKLKRDLPPMEQEAPILIP